MSTPDVRTSYDRTILTMAAAGATTAEVAAALGKTSGQIRSRALYIGAMGALARNFRDRRAAQRERPRADRPKKVGYQGSFFVAGLPAPREDRAATDLLHALRAAKRRARPSAPVPPSFIAQLHVAGLTLEDIGAEYGVAPAVAVAAIREHHGIRL